MAMCRGGVAHDNRNGVGTRATPGARDRSPGNMWSHGTTLNVFSGGALGGSDRASIRGGAFGWEIQPWFGLEGSATWIGWDKSAHAFTPAMTAQLGLHLTFWKAVLALLLWPSYLGVTFSALH